MGSRPIGRRRRVRAAATITSTNASSRTASSRVADGSGSPNTIGPAAIVVRFAAAHGQRDHRHRIAELQAARRDEQPDQRRDQDHERERVDEHADAELAQMRAERLDRSVRSRPQQPGRTASAARAGAAQRAAGDATARRTPTDGRRTPRASSGHSASGRCRRRHRSVAARNASPAAISPTPIHSRRVTSIPNSCPRRRSAARARRRSPTAPARSAPAPAPPRATPTTRARSAIPSGRAASGTAATVLRHGRLQLDLGRLPGAAELVQEPGHRPERGQQRQHQPELNGNGHAPSERSGSAGEPA